MKVVPRSLRPRRRTITTEPREAAGRARQRSLERRRRREEQTAVRLKDDDLVGGELGGRIAFDDAPIGLDRLSPDGDPVRLAMTAWSTTDSPTPKRTAYCSGMSIVSTKVTVRTVLCTRPVRQTDRRSSGLIVR